jgi:hypothetical protein
VTASGRNSSVFRRYCKSPWNLAMLHVLPTKPQDYQIVASIFFPKSVISGSDAQLATKCCYARHQACQARDNHIIPNFKETVCHKLESLWVTIMARLANSPRELFKLSAWKQRI